MPRTATGIDVGLRTAIALRGHVKDNSFVVTDFAASTHRGAQVTDGWKSFRPGFKPTAARVGLSGREVNIRYSRVPRVPDWQLRRLMRFEVAEIGDQSGAEVASDFNVLPELPEIEGEDVVLLGMARESLLADHAAGLASVGGALDSFTPNAIALYNAWLHYGVVMEDTVLVANIGCDNIDVVLVRGTDLLFARNMTGGSRLFDDAIAQRFGVGLDKAEELKERLATLEPGAHYDDSNAEKASRACMGPAGQLLSLLESTVLFCKSQMKISGLRVDRVMLCGGGSALRGLDRYLASGMSVPVELFDPFRVVDTSSLDPEVAASLEEFQLESVVALGLATTASDPQSYSIEIVPEALRKRREMLGGTAFLVAAAVVAVAFLGFLYWKSGEEIAALRSRRATLQRMFNGADSMHRETEALILDNERDAVLVDALYEMKGAGEQLARVLRGIDATLPPQFWVTDISVEEAADPELGIEVTEPRPILRVEGRAREGAEQVTYVFGEFTSSLREELGADARLKERMFNGNQAFQIDVTMFAMNDGADAGADGSR